MVMLNKGGSYLSAKTVKDGEVVKILDEGVWESSKFLREDGTPQQQFTVTVEHNGDSKKLKVTATSRNSLAEAWGYDTKNWIMKNAQINLLPIQNGKQTIWLKPVKRVENPDEIVWLDK